ncbi:MAG: cytochrome c oxidase assembly protein [Solirubrobacteraceae bacterium]
MSGDELASGLIQASPLYVLAAILALRARGLANDGRPVAGWRLALFAAGIAVAVAADLPPIGTQSEQRLSIHMVQHLLIGDLAAFLIAVAMTGPLLRPILTLPGLRHLRWLVHPLIAVPLWVLVYYGWHIPALYQAALRSNLVHASEHATMLGAGLTLWIGLLGPLPKPEWFGNAAGLAYVVVVRFAGTAIANAFIWSTTPFYPTYEAIARSRGIDAAADQSIAGAIWMLEGSLVTVGVLAWIFARWMSQGEATQELVEYAERLGIELDPARARRAVAAGYGERLRQRLDEQAAKPPPSSERHPPP